MKFKSQARQNQLTDRKARALIATAERSVGSGQAAQAYKFHLKQLLAQYDLACA